MMTLDWGQTSAAIWQHSKNRLRPVRAIDPIRLSDLMGIELQKQQLINNTRRFLDKKPVNHALLWGARGTGKSSLVKAVLNEFFDEGLRLIEVFKQDLLDLPEIVDDLRQVPQRFIIYCDDFSFDANENTYLGLKTILEGSIEQPPENIVLYATSNRRHLLPEFMQDNLGTELVDDELHYSDAVEEKISLSDRFGLCLSFPPGNMENYLCIVDSYFKDFSGDKALLREAAKMFAMARASKSGRTANQFYRYYSDSTV